MVKGESHYEVPRKVKCQALHQVLFQATRIVATIKKFMQNHGGKGEKEFKLLSHPSPSGVEHFVHA